MSLCVLYFFPEDMSFWSQAIDLEPAVEPSNNVTSNTGARNISASNTTNVQRGSRATNQHSHNQQHTMHRTASGT